MKKNSRKVISIILSLVMATALIAIPAVADEVTYDPALNETELTMILGGELFLLEVNDLPPEATVTWASSDFRVVRPSSNGYIISVGKGVANVTARITGGGLAAPITLTCAVNVITQPLLITNGVVHMDTDGNPIFAQMGSINMYNDGTGKYWWYGINLQNARGYYSSLRNSKGTLGANGVAAGTHVEIYSSTNLVDWTYEGRAATLGQNSWPASGWFGRMGVVYNDKYGTYHMMGQSGGSNGVFHASSPTPHGPWTWHGVQANLNTLGAPSAGTGDQTVFYDSYTGEAYLIFDNNGMSVPGHTWSRNATTGLWTIGNVNTLGGANQNFMETLPERDEVYVGILSDNYRSIVEVRKIYDAKEDNFYHLNREGGREANGMFRYDGWYYTFASGLRGWNTGPTFYMGGARNATDQTFVNEVGLPNNMTPMRGSAANNGHTSQVVGVIVTDVDKITPQAPVGQMVLQMGDRWTNQAGYGYGFEVFNPISMVDAADLGAPTDRDIPRVPVPSQFPVPLPSSWFAPTQDLSHRGFQNPAIWATMDTFFPHLPKGYEEAMGSDEWVRPEWPIPVFNNVSQFYYDIENAEWSVGPNNNYLDNAQFECDRVAGGRDVLINGLVHTKTVIQSYVNRPIGWQIEEPAGQAPAQVNWGGGGNSRASGVNVFRYQLGNPETYSAGLPTQSWYSAWAGNHTWYHGYSKRNEGTEPYQAKTYQVAEVPDGFYNFYGWVRSSGGQNEAYIYAGDLKCDINTPINAWTLVAIENFEVTGGQIEVGFYSDAAAGQWIYFDDFALVPQKINKAKLAELVDEADLLDTLDYTTASWNKLIAALDVAKAVLADDVARQNNVNSSWYKLLKAIEALEETTFVKATPTAWVKKLNGNTNELYITVTETYCNGKTIKLELMFSIKNNAEGFYQVGPYRVFVDTKGNDQIRQIYIVA